MNDRPVYETEEQAAADEAMLQDVFDQTALMPSDDALARLVESSARIPSDELRRSSPGVGRQRPVVLFAVAAMLAAVVGAGLYLTVDRSVPEEIEEIPMVTEGIGDRVAEPTSPDSAMAGEAVPGWDDETSRLEADADALAMLDGDPLAALDSWQDDDLFADDLAADDLIADHLIPTDAKDP